MKKNILFLLMFLLMPMSVYADSLNLSCPNEINKGDEFTCTLSGNSDKSITSLSAKVKIGSGASFVMFTPSNNWQGDGVNGEIDLYTADGMSGNFKIGTIKVKNNSYSDNIVTIESIFFYGSDDSENSLNSISKTISIKEVNDDNNVVNNNDSNNSNNSNNSNSDNTNVESNNSADTSDNEIKEENNSVNSFYLLDIEIENYDLNFSKEIFDYTLRINDETSLIINPKLENDDLIYVVKGNNDLKNGSLITIEVSSDNGEFQEYRINIEKNNGGSSEKNNNYTFIFWIIIAMLLVINIGRMFVKWRNKDEE